MRLQGKVTRWDDEKGFGFITWPGDGSTIFVHIKAIAGTSRRPAVGDVVSYEVTRGGDGRKRAVKVRFAGAVPSERHSTGKHRDTLTPVLLTTFFVFFLLGGAALGRIPWWVVAACLVLSFAAFVMYAWDKASARSGRWRTPESTLLFVGLIGGWPGAVAAQRLLRHKCRKQSFLSVFWVTVFLNVVVFGYFLWRGGANFIR